MPSSRFNFEKITIILAIPIILLIAAASAFMFIGAVTDNQMVRNLGDYSSIPIFVWTAVPLLAVLFIILYAAFRKVVRLLKPQAFARKIAAPLEYVPKPPTAAARNGKRTMSDEEILKVLLKVPPEPTRPESATRPVDWSELNNTGNLFSGMESAIPPDSGVKVVEVPKHDTTLEAHSDFEQICVENLRQPGNTKKLVLVWRTVNDAIFEPICDFLARVISSALRAGAELKDHLKLFVPWRDKLVSELWKRLAMDDNAMKRLGAADVYQLLPIVMEMCLPVPMAA
jgi:hypothetical protein